MQGVRDENTKNIVGKLVAKQVEIVCDPTMLLPINELGIFRTNVRLKIDI